MPRFKILYVNSPKYDITTALHIEGLNKIADADVRYTTLGNYAPKEKVLCKKDAIAYGNDEANIVILGSRPFVDDEIFWSIRKKGVVRVRMEGGDESALSVRTLEFYRYNYIFKRELYQTINKLRFFYVSLWPSHVGLWKTLYAPSLFPFPFYHSMHSLRPLQTIPKNIIWWAWRQKVYPFPFGIEDRFRASINYEPDYDLSCILTPHLNDRTELIELIRRKRTPRTFIGTIQPGKDDVRWMVEHGACSPDMVSEGGVGFAQNTRYYHQVHNSRACISVPGGGFDTLRFWEILGMGSLLISKRIALRMPHPFIEGEHYMAFDTKDELKSIIDWLFANPDRADDIRKKGHEYALRYHTSIARAEYFMNIISANFNR